jgi:hypothetical protein
MLQQRAEGLIVMINSVKRKTHLPASPPAKSHHLDKIQTPCWPVSGLTETTFITFPNTHSKHSVVELMKMEPLEGSSVLPLRGQRRLKRRPSGHAHSASRLTSACESHREHQTCEVEFKGD